VTAVASPAPAPVSVSPGVSPTPESKVITEEAPEVAPVEETPAPISPETLTEEVEVVTVVETAPETPVSLVGEPVARHEEPVAAAESAPDAVTPRSESAEPAVPEKVVVRPAKTASPKSKEAGAAKATSAAEKNGKGGKKTAKPSHTDDFTTILDIGPVFNQKLHEAGIKSFKDLARLTPAQIEEKTGIPAERIESGRWLEQVQQILAEKPKE
jgi:predicted flap endonuclease-1-like 5' DNA nuclease